MATQLIPDEIEEVPARAGLTLRQILAPGLNLATLLDESKLNEIGQRVITDVEIDEGSRGEWLTRYERWLDVAMQVKKAKNFPWPDAANTKLPILTVAAIQFQAEAYPVIVDGSNLVKGRVLGPDPDGTKRARADRMGQHMSWQLLYRMENWEEETDFLLLALPITGTCIRKTYYDSVDNANCSEIISGKDFIINYWAKSIEKAPRYTHVLRYYPYEVREKISAGLWLEVPLDDDGENADGNDDQSLGEYYEQHRCIDLDGDGYPEHYVVTCTKEGKIARIVPCFGLDGVTVKMPDELPPPFGGRMLRLDELLRQGGIDPALYGEVADLLPEFHIVKIERRRYFTKYGFIPAPDGSFYDQGFGALLESLTNGSDTLVNQMLDSASLQNAGGGFVGSGVQVRGGNFAFRLGEWKRVDVAGGLLKDNIVPLPTSGPSSVSFSLLELLLASAKDITSSQDVVAGRATPNQPATTTLALLEQAQTVRKGIYKRIHRAFGKELRCLRHLNQDFLDEEEYFQLNDSDEAVRIGRADYEDRDLDVVPVSDPGQVSDMQKITRSEAIFAQFNGDPLINQKLLREDFLVAVGAKDIPRYFEVPPPMPDPKLVAEAEKDAAAADESKAGASEKRMNTARAALEMGLVEDAAALAAEAVGDTDAQAPAGPGGLPGMEGPAPDAGIPLLPPGPADGPVEGVGPGSFPAAGAPGAGGPARPTGGAEF